MTLTDRQKQILDLLDGREDLSRFEIATLLSKEIPVSRITIIRDLNTLVDRKLVSVSGKGKATAYSLLEKNPVLQKIAIETYFDKPANQRDARIRFNDDVYASLSNLFSEKEKVEIDRTRTLYAENVNNLQPAIYRRELERFVIEFSWKSSQIEGNTYDLLETETLIKQKIEARGRTKAEAIMILNHKDAFDAVLKHSKTFKNLSLSDLTQLHGIMVQGLNVPSGIRSQAVRITGTQYVPFSNEHELTDQLRAIITLINKTPYPPAKALLSLCMIAYLQPFADGNKRTSRMLSNAILVAHGYYPLSFRDVDVNEFVKATILFYEQNNLYHLKRLFLEQIQFSTENYFKQ